MIRRAWLGLLCGIVIAWSVATSVEAAITYSYAFDASSYLVDPGGKRAVQVFVQEAGQSGDTSLLSTQGLTSAAVTLIYTGAIPSTPAYIDPNETFPGSLDIIDIVPNPDFDGALYAWEEVLPSPGVAYLLELSALAGAKGSLDTDLSGNWVSRVLLGTFTFTGGSAGDITTTIMAVDPDYPDPAGTKGQTMTYDSLTVLDSLLSTATATITTTELSADVPEPAAWLTWIGLTGVFGVGGMIRRRSRT
jgi:hypothetical protein